MGYEEREAPTNQPFVQLTPDGLKLLVQDSGATAPDGSRLFVLAPPTQPLLQTILTRNDNATPYAAGQAIGGHSENDIKGANLRFDYAGRYGVISRARLATNHGACVAQIRLFLFATRQVIGPPDGAVQAGMHPADNDIRLGYLDFPPLSSEGLVAQAAEAQLTPGTPGAPLPFPYWTLYGALWGMLVPMTDFTPIPEQQFVVELQ